MKFLKEDGTVEEGVMLTDEQDALRGSLEEYIHQVVCRNAYHGNYDKRPCRQASNFLYAAITFNDSTDQGVANAIKSELESLKPKPAPEPEVTETVVKEKEEEAF